MKRRQSERGTVALEFALLLPVVLLLVGTMVITGMRGVYSALAVHEARIAAREASIRTGQSTSSPYPSEADICNPSTRSLAFPGSILIQCEVLNLSRNLSQGDGDVVTVTLTYELRPLTALANFVASSFRAADLAILTQRASVMRE